MSRPFLLETKARTRGRILGGGSFYSSVLLSYLLLLVFYPLRGLLPHRPFAHTRINVGSPQCALRCCLPLPEGPLILALLDQSAAFFPGNLRAALA